MQIVSRREWIRWQIFCNASLEAIHSFGYFASACVKLTRILSELRKYSLYLYIVLHAQLRPFGHENYYFSFPWIFSYCQVLVTCVLAWLNRRTRCSLEGQNLAVWLFFFVTAGRILNPSVRCYPSQNGQLGTKQWNTVPWLINAIL